MFCLCTFVLTKQMHLTAHKLYMHKQQIQSALSDQFNSRLTHDLGEIYLETA